MNTARRFDHRALALLVAGTLSIMTVAFAAQAHAQATSTASSTNGTLAGTVATTTAPMISGIAFSSVDTTAGTITVVWNTDVPATSQVFYGTSLAFDKSTPYQGGLTTSHSAVMTGLAPDTTYYFAVGSNDASGANTMSQNYMFTMPAASGSGNSTGTTTGSTTGSTTGTGTTTGSTTGSASGSTTGTASSTSDDIAALQARVSALESLVNALQSTITTLQSDYQSLLNGQTTIGTGSGSGSTGSGSTSTTTSQTGTGTGVISPNNQSVRAGTTVDFTGRGFWNDEPVTVMNNGQTVSTARADGGGNFSTGSLPVTTTLGTQTYTFIGQWSGITGSASINVTP